ncbi:type II secretion system ATPase GspE [Citrobacter rodentium]|uniref:Type II secretion system protein E n=2 Tax=Citrobacter rodentium TaxID=67825 RepID=D2TMH7_CITRI|nr:type II secretion system ATPase GspE [Citrobacter rodentium]KIQ52833.1 general secretion pathway protein GspE [Citrobacter rodentium]QBY30761.1 type II secretion system protein GspE [Citrobacter rodentium]UHO31872.1 type II secretion system ATPase GspE [Citrobacter rodentium NBRC 105723 = DSM 16636]CBG91191.1 putative T2SS protein E [Citrobacter rodentium ICC168]HAT8014563.1 type II secretion system protein GspE [Citrobacter rodentium NBRC 105723 = DSM 16636]
MKQLNWRKAQQHGVVVHHDEVIYADTVPLDRLLDVAAARSLRFTRLNAQQFEERLEILFQQDSGTAQLIAEDISNSDDLSALSEEIPMNEDLLNEQSDAPVIRLINAVLSEAIKEHASDIHIEIFEKKMSIRFRVDGVLRQVVQPDKKLASLLISRIKVMAKLDIAEKRLPQDGRITLKIGHRNIDVRVSTLPSQHGERVVLRLLDKSSLRLSVDKLDMSAQDAEDLKRLIALPHGIILVTGPTGSGKSTTLYAILSALNSPERNILTVEDPIEYELEGIGQTQVNSRVDMSFARGLRAILRQDPDVVMVGEIRDAETARIAVQASLTGHLVLSTLHTNSASGAVTRLRDMGTESFLLSSSLVGVIAQRLVRRLCQHCKSVHPLTPQQAQLLRSHGFTSAQLWQAKGCPVCRQSGYQGRLALHELLIVTPEIRAAIHSEVNEQQLEALQTRQHRNLLANGLRVAVEGLTSLDEVLRVTAEGDGSQEVAP